MAAQGHCMCGAVKVTVSDPASQSVFCHCDNCRRQSGATGTIITLVDEDSTKVEGPIKVYNDQKTDSGTPLERWFCEECGCPVYSKTPIMKGKLAIKMGLFTDIPKPPAEWYCKNKLNWEANVEGAKQVEACG